MAKYSAVKATVNAYIKQNGRKEITGRILNAVLNATIDSLGRFFQFAGGAMPTDDPGTPDQNVCYLAGEPGVYTNFGGITIENEEVALLFWDGEWTKQRILIGIREVNASVDNQVGTPSVDVSYSGGELVLTFHNLKGDQGETGDPAGFGTIGADINGGVGTPGVSVETSGDNTAKNLMFHFTNLKGETGVTSVVATIDNTSGTPSCQVSLVGQQLTLAFSGLKGLKGDTGVSADYPITIYNGLDSDATDQALAAAQGKVLDGKVSQLGQEVNEKNQLLQLEELPGAIQSTTWNMRSDLTHFIIPVNGGDEIEFDNSAGTMYCAFLKSYTTPVAGATPDFCAGYVGRQSKSETLGAFSLPSDCSFLVINNPYGNWVLSSLKINGVEMIQGLRGSVLGLVKAINTNISSLDGRITTNENNIIATKSSHTSIICYTSASTAGKIVATANIPQLTLDKNVRVLVTFIAGNTANDATLLLGNTVAKPLYYRGVRASSTNTWQAGQTLDIRYDATNERYMAEPWDGVALVSDLQKVENEIRDEIGNIESALQDCIKPSDFSYTVTSNNIAFPDGIVEDYLVADGGAIGPSTSGWCMYKLPVTPGMILTVGGFYLGRNAYYAFYNGDTLVEYHGLPDPNGTTTPLTVTIPSGVTHFYFDIKTNQSPENPYAFLQINVGNSLLAYDEPTRVIYEIKGEKIAGSGNAETIPDLLADLPVSDGAGISAGYAYIESSTGVVKVKML